MALSLSRCNILSPSPFPINRHDRMGSTICLSISNTFATKIGFIPRLDSPKLNSRFSLSFLSPFAGNFASIKLSSSMDTSLQVKASSSAIGTLPVALFVKFAVGPNSTQKDPPTSGHNELGTYTMLNFQSGLTPPKKIISQGSRIASTLLYATSEGLDASSAMAIGANDLLIVGPGVLGRLVAGIWREEHPGCQIFGQTMTTDHHDELTKMGIKPSLKETKFSDKFPYIIFCAPPSRTEDYPADVREAASKWNGEGSFVFTSSSAVYDCYDNGSCNEDTPVVSIGSSPRTDVLLKAEKAVLEFGGNILRLAGLYTADRGAHTYWLSKGTLDSRADHILNLIHYEDAASLAVVILKKKLCGQIFLGCDNHPLSRQEVMDLVNKSGEYSSKFKGFTGNSGPLGKKLNNSKTRATLGWEPKYPSFAQFLGVSE